MRKTSFDGKCPDGLGDQLEHGLRCDYFGEHGCCRNGSMELEKWKTVAEQEQCSHAKIQNVFGTLTIGKFEKDSTDPTGLGRLRQALLNRFSTASESDFPLPVQPSVTE